MTPNPLSGWPGTPAPIEPMKPVDVLQRLHSMLAATAPSAASREGQMLRLVLAGLKGSEMPETLLNTTRRNQP